MGLKKFLNWIRGLDEEQKNGSELYAGRRSKKDTRIQHFTISNVQHVYVATVLLMADLSSRMILANIRTH